jgi:tetratricopeptide (TPR) repeat protein
VNLAYFGQADPAYYGINCTHLPGAPSFASESIARPKLPGYVAISATTLTGVYAPPWWRLFYAAFRDLEPVAIIGNSIRVYWVDDWPELENPMALSSEPETQRALADALLFGFQWPDHAARHYREYLAARPADTGALVNYGLALAAAHQTTAAIAALQRAVGADPSHGLAHVTLGQLFLATRDLDAAATHAERAVTLIPQHADAHFLIARVHAVQGLREEAARDLARVLEIEPGHVAAQEYLRRVTAATPRGLLRATPSKPSP